MVDFRESFSIGINAAERAEANRKEISMVFKDLNNQLKDATNGKILIRIATMKDHNAQYGIFLTAPTYTAIVAENPCDSSKIEELAKLRQGKVGYPCKITFGNDEIHCEDRAALEEGLSRLLQDPIVGEKLYKLMNLPDTDKKVQEDEARAMSEKNNG